MEDVALLAVGVRDERDARRPVGIVLDRAHRAGDAHFVALEVDDAVLTLVATAATAHRDVTVVVAAAGLLDRLEQRLLRRGAGDLGEIGHAAEARSFRYWSELTNTHEFPLMAPSFGASRLRSEFSFSLSFEDG